MRPLLEARADIVVGERPISQIQHFSPLKKWLQRFGSMLVRWLSRTEVRDSPSGFRALTRRAVLRTNIFNRYTYTHEMLIGSGRKGLRVLGVPIRVNPGKQRPSRLVKSVFSYVYRSGVTIVRMYYVYAPARFFTKVAAFFGTLSLILIARFFYYYFFTNQGNGWIQSAHLRRDRRHVHRALARARDPGRHDQREPHDPRRHSIHAAREVVSRASLTTAAAAADPMDRRAKPDSNKSKNDKRRRRAAD